MTSTETHAPTPCAAWRSPRTACASSSTTPSCGAAARRRCAFRIVDDARRDGARLRRRAREAHAPDPRPPRPDRLPAPAPRAGRRRQLATPRARSTTPAPTGCSPTSRTTARRGRWRPTCASTAPPTCGRCPTREPTAVSDGGYDVRLDAGAARPGEEADLRFTITRDGEPVRTEPYLGAGGHLVALRDGDLAFLHVHPTDDAASASPPRSRPRAATGCSCSSSTTAASTPSRSRRR